MSMADRIIRNLEATVTCNEFRAKQNKAARAWRAMRKRSDSPLDVNFITITTMNGTKVIGVAENLSLVRHSVTRKD